MAAKDIEKAILAARLYHGSQGCALRVQQKLYDRKKRAAESVRKRTGVDSAEEQISREAERRGPMTPTAGKDY